MWRSRSIGDVPQRVRQYFFRDGLTELRWGLLLLSVSAPNAAYHLHLPSFENPFVLAASLLMLLAAGPGVWWARQHLSYPRLGTVTLRPLPPALYLLLGLLILGITRLVWLDVQGTVRWGAEVVVLLYPLWLALMGYHTRFRRFWAAASILALSVLAMALLALSPYAVINLQMALAGGLLISSGLGTWITFVRREPAVLVEDSHAL